MKEEAYVSIIDTESDTKRKNVFSLTEGLSTGKFQQKSIRNKSSQQKSV